MMRLACACDGSSVTQSLHLAPVDRVSCAELLNVPSCPWLKPARSGESEGHQGAGLAQRAPGEECGPGTPPGGEAAQAASQRNARPPTMQRNCIAELPRCWPIGRQSLIIWRNAHCKGCPPKRLLNPITRCPPFPKTALSNTSNSRSPASPQE